MPLKIRNNLTPVDDSKRRTGDHLFKKGQSGNPGGIGAGRKKLQAKFMSALADDFEKYGKQAIELARENDPMGYIRLCGTLMPKELEIIKPLDEITDEQLDAFIVCLRSCVPDNSIGGTTEAEIIQDIELLPAVPETV